MAGDVAATTAKVQQYLTQNFGNVSIDRDGNFSLRHGSVRIFVRVATRDEVDWTWVRLWILLLYRVKETPALFEHIALHKDEYLFGHLYAVRGEEGIIIGLRHVLLGEHLDEEELCRAVGSMLVSADKLDDELKTQFGGSRFHED